MKSKVLAHVDYGSKGNSGLYIKETINNLTVPEHYSKLAFVNYDYQYGSEGIVRTFEKYSKYISNDTLKKGYKFIDLFTSLLFVVIKLFKYKNTGSICVISLNGPFIHYKIFTKVLKKLSFKVYFILHDIVDLHVDAPKLILTDRRLILIEGDGCVVHTEESLNYACALGMEAIRYPFPLMEIDINCNAALKKEKPSFLFIGGVRPGKGVELLSDAFNRVFQSFPCQLTIAGRFTKNYDPTLSADPKTKVINKYLSDELYSELISECDYVILPYTEGTNSGVLSTVVSCNKPVICSDLPVFKNSSFVLKRNIFSINEEGSLGSLIEDILTDFETRRALDIHDTEAILIQYESNFKVSINEAYAQIL